MKTPAIRGFTSFDHVLEWQVLLWDLFKPLWLGHAGIKGNAQILMRNTTRVGVIETVVDENAIASYLKQVTGDGVRR